MYAGDNYFWVTGTQHACQLLKKNYPIAYSESIHVPLLIALCCAVVRVFMCALCQPNFQPIDSEYRMEIGAWVITQSHHEFILNLVMWFCQSRNSHTWKWLVTTVDVSSASWMVPIVWRVSGREGVQIMYPFWWPVAFIEQYPVPLCLVNYNIWMYAEVPIQTHWLLMFFILHDDICLVLCLLAFSAHTLFPN